ncbi:MAG TPA: DEAD/DEAH box helicase [Bacillota bacterium]|nr:DEAD/DEAH box helicase [Bacillota bacterium]
MEVTFETLSLKQDFLKAAWNKAGFENPTAIQFKAIPVIGQGNDLIAESPTGTGKTLAYLLPLLDAINPEQKNTQIIVIAPTRELTMQISKHIQVFIQDSQIKSAAFIGGADLKRQLEKLKTHPHIIVGTPQRLLELIKMKKLKTHELRTIVVDEVDQIVKMELLRTVQEVISMTPKERQLVCLSATISMRIQEQIIKIMKTPQIIRIQKSDLPESQVEHVYVVGERRDKWDLLRRIVKMDKLKAVAFIGDMKQMKEIADRLRNKEIALGILNGEMKKVEREAVMNQFRLGKFPLLLATDLAARGLDIEGITHVIHYDIPQDPEQYVHRSGRTGRMGAKGMVVSLVTASEVVPLQKMMNGLGISISEKQLYMGKMEDAKPKKEKMPPKKMVKKK